MSMIQVQEALDKILCQIQFKGVERVPLGQALGRVLTEDVVSCINNPPLDNSAMDGYAVIAEDIQSATPENPYFSLNNVGTPPGMAQAGGTATTKWDPPPEINLRDYPPSLS